MEDANNADMDQPITLHFKNVLISAMKMKFTLLMDAFAETDITELKVPVRDVPMASSGTHKLEAVDAIEVKNYLMGMYANLIVKSMKKELDITANVKGGSNGSMENVINALQTAIMTHWPKVAHVSMAILWSKVNAWLYAHLINTLIQKLIYALIIAKVGEKYMSMENVFALMILKDWMDSVCLNAGPWNIAITWTNVYVLMDIGKILMGNADLSIALQELIGMLQWKIVFPTVEHSKFSLMEFVSVNSDIKKIISMVNVSLTVILLKWESMAFANVPPGIGLFQEDIVFLIVLQEVLISMAYVFAEKIVEINQGPTVHTAKLMTQFLGNVDANLLKFGSKGNVFNIILVAWMNIGVEVIVLVKMDFTELMELANKFLLNHNVLTILFSMVLTVSVTMDSTQWLQEYVFNALQELSG